MKDVKTRYYLPSHLLIACLIATAGTNASHAQDVRSAVGASISQEASDDWDKPSLWLSTAALDNALSTSFLSTQVGLSVVLPHQNVPAPPPSPVMTTPCEEKNCSSTRGCNSDCKSDCDKDVVVLGVKVGTATDPVCFAGCEAGKLSCEALKKAEHDACEAAKTLYLGFCGKKLGTLSLSDVSADAIVGLTNLKLTTNLASRSANLSGDIGGKATIQGHLRFQPEPLIIPLAGCVVFDGWLPPQATEIQTKGFSLDGKLEIAKVQSQSKRFQIELGLSPIDVNVTVEGNPIIDIVTNNPLNFVSCPGLSLVGVAVDTFKRDYDFASSVSLPQPPPIVIGTIDLDPNIFSGPKPSGTGPSLAFRSPQ
jgi:hypothetical protein